MSSFRNSLSPSGLVFSVIYSHNSMLIFIQKLQRVARIKYTHYAGLLRYNLTTNYLTLYKCPDLTKIENSPSYLWILPPANCTNISAIFLLWTCSLLRVKALFLMRIESRYSICAIFPNFRSIIYRFFDKNSTCRPIVI